MIRATFIGVDRHADDSIRDLGGAARDATALWAILSDSVDGLDAPLLLDQQATCEAATAAIRQTLEQAEANDVVLLSFAGHGTVDHRLVFHDTRVEDIPGTTFEMSKLAEMFRLCQARAIVLILDCCFSGGAPSRVLDIGVVPRDIGEPLRELSGTGRVLLAASAAHQPALEDQQTGHGLFTKALLDGLLAAKAPMNVMALAEEATRHVRVAAGKLGYAQTPVTFGHVEGELVLPPARLGERWRNAFPQRSPIKVSRDFAELSHYGIREEVLAAWKERYPTGLNNLQLTAINEHNVLGGESLLCVAPTSAGKTFVGELAAVKAVMDGRKAVFLLPFRALVNEKFEDFTNLYGNKLGLRIARCSGDWQDQVGDVLRNKYDIAFFTYEKFLAMVAAAPYLLTQLGLVVLDEAQFITEPGRGMAVELLLTHLVQARNTGVAPQLIALSAVIGNTNQFERWLGCRLLHSTERPVPLREGVIGRDGVWHFADLTGEAKNESLLPAGEVKIRGPKQSSQDVIVPLVRRLVADGEKVLIFRNARGLTSGCAAYLARALGLPPAQTVLDLLPEGDRSAMSVSLREVLAGGVAFHNGDLTREERVAVEQGFRSTDAGVRVLVATSTVAAGVNTPASTVIIVETFFPAGGGEKTPYTVATYKNMAGRAGRLGFESEGKTIIIADSNQERWQFLQRYVKGHPEPIRSSFNEADPGTWVIRLLTQMSGIARGAVADLLTNTYGGYLASLPDPNWKGRMDPYLDRLVEQMIRNGLVEECDGHLYLTLLGRACGESPMTLQSGMVAVELIRKLSPEAVSLETLVMLTEALPERDGDYTPQVRGAGETSWQVSAAQRFGPALARILQFQARSDRDYYARCKRALIVQDWIDGAATGAIEAKYSANPYCRVGHGDIRGFADGCRMLLDSVVRIAAIVLETAFDTDATAALQKRLEVGVPTDLLGLVSSKLPLNRGELLALRGAGVLTAGGIAKLTDSQAYQLFGQRGNSLRLKAASIANAFTQDTLEESKAPLDPIVTT
jgi:replicative superfamily II helicase